MPITSICITCHMSCLDGTTKLVYSYSTRNPSTNNGIPTYHDGGMGTRNARLLDARPAVPVLPAGETHAHQIRGIRDDMRVMRCDRDARSITLVIMLICMSSCMSELTPLLSLLDARPLDLAIPSTTIPFPTSDPTTSYYCTLFAINTTSRAHVVQWEPLFSPPENKKYVHHILVYQCDTASEWTHARAHIK